MQEPRSISISVQMFYYDNAERGFRAHDTLGLYKNKSVRAIGKVIARITAVETENGVKYNAEFGELTDERKSIIALERLNTDTSLWRSSTKLIIRR